LAFAICIKIDFWPQPLLHCFSIAFVVSALVAAVVVAVVADLSAGQLCGSLVSTSNGIFLPVL